MKGNSDLAAGEADWFVRTLFKALESGLVQEGRVELRGFGVFQVKGRAQADFVNPIDGHRYSGSTIRVVQFTSTAKARGWEDVD